MHLCQRHSRDAPPHTVQGLWFSILQSFVRLLHHLRQRTGLPPPLPTPAYPPPKRSLF